MELKELTIKELLSDNILVIPEIQREYVWGCNKDVLVKFLSELNVSLQNDSDSNIGFLYSYDTENKKENADSREHFVIDGQQRLTTIVILAYYYAVKDERVSDFKTFLKTESPLAHFSYRVRPLTEQFLQNLFADDRVSLAILKNLKEAKWYISDYDNDLTIKSIYELFKFFSENEKLFANLNYDSLLQHVKFYYFDVKQTSQGEELYITMNSRGEQLKDSEQIKPYILEKMEKEERKDAAKQWDEWEEFFYKKLKETVEEINEDEVSKIDIAMDNIIRIALELYGKKIDSENERKWEFKTELKASEDSARIDFSKISKVVENIKLLIDSKDDEIRKLGFVTFLFAKNRDDKSLYLYLIESLIRAKELEFNDKNIHRLIRLVNNSLSYGIIKHVPLLKFLSQLKRTENIYQYINSHQDMIKNVFINEENTEELEKIKAVLYGSVTEDDIDKAEKTAFFDGRIHFLYRDAEGKLCWKGFGKKWKNAQKYFDANGVTEGYRKNAILLRSFISKYNEWGDFWGVEYDNEASTWKKLLTSRLKSAHSILVNTVNKNEDFSTFKASLKAYDVGYEDLENAVQQDLVKTPILVEASNLHSTLNWRYNTYCLYPSGSRKEIEKYVIANKRNAILSELMRKGKIECAQKIEGCDFFWGWDIYFKYKRKDIDYYFQWRRSSDKTRLDVYLMKKGWNGCEKRHPRTYDKKTEADTHYCFKVTPKMGKNTTLFTKELDRLIAEAPSKG